MQMSLLARLLIEACSEPFFVTALHESMSQTLGVRHAERARTGETLAAPLCETLRGDRLEQLEWVSALSVPQRIAVAAALQSAPSIASKRFDPMVSEILSIGLASGAGFSDFESCALAAAIAPEVLAGVASAGDLEEIRSSMTSAVWGDVVLRALAHSERVRRYSVLPPTSAIEPVLSTDGNYDRAAYGAAAVSALVDLGPAMCTDVDVLGSVVHDVDIASLADVDAATLVALTADVLDHHLASSQFTTSRVRALAVRSALHNAEMSVAQTRRLDIVVHVLGQGARAWSETRVAHALDSDRIYIASPDCARIVIMTFAALLGRPFPTGVLLRTWCYRERAQLPLTAAAVSLASVVHERAHTYIDMLLRSCFWRKARRLSLPSQKQVCLGDLLPPS